MKEKKFDKDQISNIILKGYKNKLQYKTIADMLNNLGFTTRYGIEWTSNNVNEFAIRVLNVPLKRPRKNKDITPKTETTNDNITFDESYAGITDNDFENMGRELLGLDKNDLKEKINNRYLINESVNIFINKKWVKAEIINIDIDTKKGKRFGKIIYLVKFWNGLAIEYTQDELFKFEQEYKIFKSNINQNENIYDIAFMCIESNPIKNEISKDKLMRFNYYVNILKQSNKEELENFKKHYLYSDDRKQLELELPIQNNDIKNEIANLTDRIAEISECVKELAQKVNNNTINENKTTDNKKDFISQLIKNCQEIDNK